MKVRFSQIMGAASALAACASPSEALADDLFLKLEGVKGDSVAANHKDEIQILSFSMGHSRPFDASAGGGAGSSKPSFSDLNVQSTLSSASPKLAELCAIGKSIPTAKLFVQGTSGSKAPGDYYVVELEEVHITSFYTSASASGSKPTESYSLSFSKISWTYKPSVADGKASAADLKGSFNIPSNTP